MPKQFNAPKLLERALPLPKFAGPLKAHLTFVLGVSFLAVTPFVMVANLIASSDCFQLGCDCWGMTRFALFDKNQSTVPLLSCCA